MVVAPDRLAPRGEGPSHHLAKTRSRVTPTAMTVHRTVATIISMRRTLGERFGAFLTSTYILRSLKLHAAASTIPRGMRTEFGSCHQIFLSRSHIADDM